MTIGDEVKWALFKGIEYEGPNTGKLTLFVVGDAPLEKICSMLYDHRIAYVYFGAGGRFDYNPDTVTAIAKNKANIYPITCVTVESPVYIKTLHKQFGDDCIWVIPYIWNCNILEVGLANIQELLSDDVYLMTTNGMLYAKVDTGKDVFITPLVDCFWNRIDKRYDSDILLCKEER